MPAERIVFRRASRVVPASVQSFSANCLPCKRRKKRCDRVKPCISCILHRCEDECYADAVVAERSEMADVLEATKDAQADHDPLDVAYYTTTSTEREFDTMAITSIRSTIALALPSAYTCCCLIDFAKDVLGEASFLPVELLHQTALDIENSNDSSRACSDDDTFVQSSARRISLLFWVLSYAALNIPSQHELVHMTNFDLRKSIGLWKRVAVEVDERKRKTDDRSQIMLDIFSLTVQTIWHAACGDLHQIWLASGAAIREGTLIGIFHNCGIREDRNAFLAAHKLLWLDRWTAFDRILPLGIVRDEDSLHWRARQHTAVLDDTTWDHKEAGFSLQLCLERKHIHMFELGRKVRRVCQTNRIEQQLQRREVIDALHQINEERISGLRLIEQKTGGVQLSSSVKALCRMPMRQALLIAEWIARCAYISCVCCSFFIRHDPGAPASLREASLWNAYEVLKVCPVFIKVARSATMAYNPTRISSMLFGALRAVIVFSATEAVSESRDSTLMGYLQRQHRGRQGFTPSPTPFSGQREDCNPSTSTPSTRTVHGPSVSPQTLSDGHHVLFDHKDIEARQAEVDVSQLVNSAIECVEQMRKTGSVVAERVLLLVYRALQHRPSRPPDKSSTANEVDEGTDVSPSAEVSDVAASAETFDIGVDRSLPDDARRMDPMPSSVSISAEDALLALCEPEMDGILGSFFQVPGNNDSIHGGPSFAHVPLDKFVIGEDVV